MRHYAYSNFEKPLAVIVSNIGSDGHDVAKQFAEKGYDLIVAASNPSVVEEAEEFKEFGVDAVSFQLDLTTAEGVEQLYSKIIGTGRPVDAIVINTEKNDERSLKTFLAKKVLKDMTNQGYGKILLIENDHNVNLDGMKKSLQKEAKGSGVTVSVLKNKH